MKRKNRKIFLGHDLGNVPEPPTTILLSDVIGQFWEKVKNNYKISENKVKIKP